MNQQCEFDFYVNILIKITDVFDSRKDSPKKNQTPPIMNSND